MTVSGPFEETKASRVINLFDISHVFPTSAVDITEYDVTRVIMAGSKWNTFSDVSQPSLFGNTF